MGLAFALRGEQGAQSRGGGEGRRALQAWQQAAPASGLGTVPDAGHRRYAPPVRAGPVGHGRLPRADAVGHQQDAVGGEVVLVQAQQGAEVAGGRPGQPLGPPVAAAGQAEQVGAEVGGVQLRVQVAPVVVLADGHPRPYGDEDQEGVGRREREPAAGQCVGDLLPFVEQAAAAPGDVHGEDPRSAGPVRDDVGLVRVQRAGRGHRGSAVQRALRGGLEQGERAAQLPGQVDAPRFGGAVGDGGEGHLLPEAQGVVRGRVRGAGAGAGAGGRVPDVGLDALGRPAVHHGGFVVHRFASPSCRGGFGLGV